MKRLILILTLMLAGNAHAGSRVLVIDTTSKESAPVDAKLRVDTVVATGAITAESFSTTSDGSNGGALVLEDADASNHARIQAPDTVTGDANYILPAAPASGIPKFAASGTNVTVSVVSFPVEIGVAASDESTDLTTGTAKITFRAPFAFTLTEVRASVNTAPTGSTIVVGINEAGSSVLSTDLSIDASEETSTTAATAAVISDSAIADDAELTIDIDQIGSSTAGTGLKVWLIGTRTL